MFPLISGIRRVAQIFFHGFGEFHEVADRDAFVLLVLNEDAPALVAVGVSLGSCEYLEAEGVIPVGRVEQDDIRASVGRPFLLQRLVRTGDIYHEGRNLGVVLPEPAHHHREHFVFVLHIQMIDVIDVTSF